jgi:hypothetical protein
MLARRTNRDMVTVESGSRPRRVRLREAVLRHAEATGSTLAGRLLASWSKSAQLPAGGAEGRSGRQAPRGREARARGGRVAAGIGDGAFVR